MEYKNCFEIMGKDRNSYSKTDLEAAFMRMKEDMLYVIGRYINRYHHFLHDKIHKFEGKTEEKAT